MEASGNQYDDLHVETSDRNKRIELANVYFFKGRKSLEKGNKDEALRNFRASVAIHEEVYGTYHIRTARSYFFLAQTLFKHTDEFDRALTAYRRALRVGLSLDVNFKYVGCAKRAIKDILSNKKAFDVKAVETYFSSIGDSIKLEKDGLRYTDESEYENALEAFEKCLVLEENSEGTFPLDLGHIHYLIAEARRKEGQHAIAVSNYRSALSIYEAALGRGHADSKLCIQGIETSLYEMNLSDSEIEEYIPLVSKSLRHCRKGDEFIESNMFNEAVNEYEAARLIEEKSLGKYPLTASTIRKKIGLAFQSLKEYDRAILELRLALSINIFECGEDHPSIVAILQDIRSIMLEKGYDFSSVNKYMNTVVFSLKHERYGEHLLLEKLDFSGAIEEFQKSLGLEVSALGKFHLTQGGLFNAIGDAFLRNMNFDFAIVNYRNALAVYQSSLGIEHDYTSSVLQSIGIAASSTGLDKDRVIQYKNIVSESIKIEHAAEKHIEDGAVGEAISSYREAICNEGSLLGHYHLSLADLHGKIAKILKKIGRYDGAIVSYHCILAINLKSLGIDHMNSRNAYEDLVGVLILKGLKDEHALSYGKNAKLSIEHEDNGDEAMSNQEFQSAISEYKKSLEIEENFLGRDHLVTEGLLRKIVKCYKLSGKTHQAFHFYRKMIRIYMKYASPDYDAPYMLRSLEKTVQDLGLSEAQTTDYIDIVKESVECEIEGDSAKVAKNYKKAIDQYSRCLLIEQSLLGMLHPSMWPVYKKIGSSFGNNGDIDSAIISHSKALAILESYLGIKEKETIETYSELLTTTLKRTDCSSDTPQLDSQENPIATIPERTLGKRYDNKTLLETTNGANDIYNAFASLRKDGVEEKSNREIDKMAILKGIAKRWNEMDEIRTIIDIHPRGNSVQNKSNSTSGPSLLQNERDIYGSIKAIKTSDINSQKKTLEEEDKTNNPNLVDAITKPHSSTNGATPSDGSEEKGELEIQSGDFTERPKISSLSGNKGNEDETCSVDKQESPLEKTLSTKVQGGDNVMDKNSNSQSLNDMVPNTVSNETLNMGAMKEQSVANAIAEVSASSESNELSLTATSDGSASKAHIIGDLGNLGIEEARKSLNDTHKMNPIGNDEIQRRDSSGKKGEERTDDLNRLKSSDAQDKGNENSPKSFEKIDFDVHIQEIPAFRSNLNDNQDASVSDSSSTSYESL